MIRYLVDLRHFQIILYEVYIFFLLKIKFLFFFIRHHQQLKMIQTVEYQIHHRYGARLVWLAIIRQ